MCHPSSHIGLDDVWCLMSYPGLGLQSTAANHRDLALDFQECLNSIHPRGESERSIAFLDIYFKREENGNLSTHVYWKPSNMNVTIKPHSCQHPDTYKGIFKA